MAATDKDTIYIDIDDEITGIIDKFKASDGKVVALVLPKRAAVLQSIVNMKLLKRAADQSKKNLVLITTEASLMPLAGAVGMHVAKTLTSKPEVPSAPLTDDGREETVSEDEDDETPDFSKSAAAGAAVGDLAGMPPKPASNDEVETLELDDDDELDENTGKTEAAGAAAVAAKVAKPKKDKKLHVPDFDRFRYMLLLAVVLIPLLLYGLYYALAVAPKAVITVDTDAVNVNASLNLTVDTTAKTLNTQENTVPGKLQTQSKTYTSQGTATGQKNQGDKATGSITASAGQCSGNVPNDVPAGTAVSSGGLTFILKDSISFTPAVSKGKCVFQGVNSSGQNSVPITAQSGGSNYNISSNASFTVSGRPDVSASGTTSGGTDDIIKVITQTDIDNAKSKVSTQDTTIKQTLITQLQQSGFFAIKNSFAAGDPTISPSAKVGDQAETFTVNETIDYKMFGAKRSDLSKLIDDSVASQIDTTKQTILSDGLDNANFTITSSDDHSAAMAVQSVATAGPDLSIDTIKQQAAGSKPGGFKNQLSSEPGVTNVDVKLSPFWVSSIPKKTSKITVTISKPTAPAKNGH